MADMMKLEGFDNLSKALLELPKRIAKNHLRRATSSAAQVIRDDARTRAPVDTGEMKRDIKIKRERSGTEIVARYSVFVLSGKKSRMAGKARNVDKNSFYWRFVEFGTAKMAARPFMRPAFEAKKEAAVKKMGEVLDAGIQSEARALHK